MRRLALPLLAAPILFLLILSLANAGKSLPPIPFSPGSCPFSMAPVVEMQGSQVTVTFPFNSLPPTVDTWTGDPYGMYCKDHTCSIYVHVTGPLPPGCKVLWVMHDDTHTYDGVPEGTDTICIYANGEKLLCDDPQNWPSFGNAPVGGSVLSINTLNLLAPWILFSSIVAVPAIALYFAKRR